MLETITLYHDDGRTLESFPYPWCLEANARLGFHPEDGPPEPFEGVTVDRLRAIADSAGVDLDGARKRADIVEALVDAGVTADPNPDQE